MASLGKFRDMLKYVVGQRVTVREQSPSDLLERVRSKVGLKSNVSLEFAMSDAGTTVELPSAALLPWWGLAQSSLTEFFVSRTFISFIPALSRRHLSSHLRGTCVGITCINLLHPL